MAFFLLAAKFIYILQTIKFKTDVRQIKYYALSTTHAVLQKLLGVHCYSVKSVYIWMKF